MALSVCVLSGEIIFQVDSISSRLFQLLNNRYELARESYKLKRNVDIAFRLHFRLCFHFHSASSIFRVMDSNILSFH